jgi:predicted permease
MNIWLQEVWRAWRASLRRPGFLLLAAGVLALGVGASVAVFTLIDNVLLKPLPYAQPGRLIALGRPTDDGRAISPYEYQHLGSLHGVVSMGLVEGLTAPVNVAGSGTPQQVQSMRVDRNVLPTLGVRLLAGRDFSVAEDRPHGPPVVILGHGFWQRRHAGDRHVIGQSMLVDGVPHTIIGVLPAGFDLYGGCDVLLPLAWPANSTDDGPNFLGVARMEPGASLDSIAAQVYTRLHALAETDGSEYRQPLHYGADSLKTTLHAGSAPMLKLFLACALFVLLIALVNLTNLILLRGLARSHDVAVRNALGASGVRLALPALAEGVLVGFGGALLGLALAASGLALFAHLVPADWLHGGTLHFGLRTAWLALGVGVLGALLSTLLGLWRARRDGGLDDLREGGRSGLSRRRGRLGRALVVVQVALAALLLCAAGLFLHAIYNAAQASLGFSARGVLVFDMAPVKADYPDTAAVQDLSRRLLERLRAQPGVEDATVTTNLPMGRWFNHGGFQLPDGTKFSTEVRGVSPDFFATFDIPLRAGRVFSRTDGHGAEAVVIVNRAFARERLGNHALGKIIGLPADHDVERSARVIGVVADTRQYNPVLPGPSILYMPLAQMPDWAMHMFRSWMPLRVALRVRGDPAGYRAMVHAAVAQVAPMQPIANVRTLQSDVRASMADTRLNLLLVGIFALLALLLAAAGMYAVMAVAVAAREREFGVRMAMGARPSRLVRLVLRGGLIQVVLGLAIGVAGAIVLSGTFGELLMDLTGTSSATDPMALTLACIVLATAGLLACLLPAMRAARVQPMRALRGE